MTDFGHEGHDFLFRGPVFFGGDHVIEIGDADFFATFFNHFLQLLFQSFRQPGQALDAAFSRDEFLAADVELGDADQQP